MTEKITFRIWPPYTDKILDVARAARLSPNQFARLATMSAADEGLINVAARLQRIEDELVRLRNDAFTASHLHVNNSRI